MYTITVKDQDKQVYKVHGSNMAMMFEQLARFIARKYQCKGR